MSDKNIKSLKSGGQVWRFDQIATNVNSRIANPSESGVTHYVGLEHLEADSLKIRRWGTPDDVEATKLMFKTGDIIFGRRRAYQRKLGVAEFDGICSAHAMVLRAKPDVVLPEFLPFFMQSDLFMHRAVEISVGSLSPTINWKTMAVQEFALPPISRQTELVEVLRAMEKVLEAQISAAEIARATRTALVEDALAANFEAKSAKPLGTYLTGLSYGSSSRSAYEELGYPILRIPNVLRGSVDYSDLQRIELNDTEYERLALREGDVLLVRTNGNPQYVGRSVVIDHIHEKTVYASYLIRIRCDESTLRPAFLAEYLNAPSTRQRLRGEVRSSAGNYNINIAGIKKQLICTPTLADQDSLLLQLKDLDAAIEVLESRYMASKSIKKQLLAEEWGRDVH
ncbi:type I restriction enzyme, S subunit [Pseudomonas sp. NFACC09-4]|uniref:restriction endonuclease subunit S n=1 Tax=Pseudomonas sp. NFACC09-4 TaxID=1566237 RepID=UPI000908F129|nr:restriction endonuclease subunit S [Pseudomonas sp. NFACC09-4]SFW20274.1 type I restriction enzyme, S subunit [Pseudomonas sp. NFACC09-4]